ncbi:MAG: J domain-containing protein [bacterium]
MADSQKNYFATLGLKPGATREEVKKAFKELAFQFHPDRNPHNPWAEERFKETVEAYSYLTGNLEALRALQGPSAAAKMTGDYAQDILKTLFDIDHPGSLRDRAPFRRELSLSLEEAFAGGTFSLLVEREELCPSCRGNGVEEGAKVFTCTYCFGAGSVSGPGETAERRECPKCNGRGFLSAKGCLRCRARGYLLQEAKLKVPLPPRVTDGFTVTLPGEGHELAPGRRGDLQVLVRLRRHPRFSFDGKDIICETSVEMSEAALGAEVMVPTLGGTTALRLPPGTQSGQVFRIKGLGLGGDQFVKINVRIPAALNEKDRLLLRRIRGEQGTEQPGWWQKIKQLFW